MPAVNPYWQQATWVIDPQNSTGLANDGNSGVDAGHPLLTYAEVAARWGTYSPRIRQSTTITFLSSHTDNTDPVNWTPYIENGAVCIITGVLGAAQQIAAGVLSNVTAKNRATPQLLLAQSGATAINQLVVNTTHPSRAWTYKVSAGAIFQMSQPLAPAIVPGTGVLAEVDTWANGDSVTVFQPVAVNLCRIEPTLVGTNGPLTNAGINLYQLTVFEPGVGDPLNISATTTFYECLVQKYVFVRTMGGFAIAPRHQNNAFLVQVNGGNIALPARFVAGFFKGLLTYQSALLDGDVILAAGAVIGSGSQGGAGLAYVETAQVLQPTGPFFGFSTSGSLYGAAILWGPGKLGVVGAARMIYPAGAGAAVASLLLTGGLTLNGLTTAYSVSTGAAAVWSGGIALTAANLDAAQGAAGFGGLAISPGGASLANGLI